MSYNIIGVPNFFTVKVPSQGSKSSPPSTPLTSSEILKKRIVSQKEDERKSSVWNSRVIIAGAIGTAVIIGLYFWSRHSISTNEAGKSLEVRVDSAGKGSEPTSEPSTGPSFNPSSIDNPVAGFVPTSEPSTGPVINPSSTDNSVAGFEPTSEPSAGPVINPSSTDNSVAGFVPTSESSAGPVINPSSTHSTAASSNANEKTDREVSLDQAKKLVDNAANIVSKNGSLQNPSAPPTSTSPRTAPLSPLQKKFQAEQDKTNQLIEDGAKIVSSRNKDK